MYVKQDPGVVLSGIDTILEFLGCTIRFTNPDPRTTIRFDKHIPQGHRTVPSYYLSRIVLHFANSDPGKGSHGRPGS